MHAEQPSVGWSFWLQWVIASIIGGLVGLAVMAETPSFLVGYVGSGGNPTTTVGYSEAWAVILGATLGGAAIGSLQWLILRRQITGITWWGVASIAGFALGFTLVWALSGAKHGSAYGHHTLPHAVDSAGMVGGVVIGAVMGSVQWLILRLHRKSAGWWIGANIVGFTAGWAGAAVMPVTGVAAHFVGGATFGIVFGAVTGAALLWLLRHPAHPLLFESQNSEEDNHMRHQQGRSSLLL